MNIYLTYGIIFVVLLVAELVYFKIADKCNIIDKPNERSSHSAIVLRGGGVIFTFAIILWAIIRMVMRDEGDSGFIELEIFEYLPFIIGLVMIAGVSFVDDIRSLPDSVRLVIQFVAMGLMFLSLGLYDGFDGFDMIDRFERIGIILLAVIVCVGITNVYNFMDGINGITGGYSLAVLVPLAIINGSGQWGMVQNGRFVDGSLIIVTILSVMVFCIFNFRPRGKAKCFAGDVGSVGIAFIILFILGRLIVKSGDVSYLMLLLVYGIDSCFTISHRISLHENLGEAHRKHVYQLMANELKMSHVTVSVIYMVLQLVISLVLIYVIPNTIAAHWIYLVCVFVILVMIYLVFMKKYYHLHEEYLRRKE